MFADIYKKIVIDFSKITLFFLIVLVGFSLYQAKNFNLDASSDALLLEGDPDLKILKRSKPDIWFKRFFSFNIYASSSFTDKETILKSSIT